MMDSAEIIAAGKKVQASRNLAESLQYHVSKFSQEEQEKFTAAIAQLNASQLNEIQHIVSTAAKESKSMRQILDLISEYLVPQHSPTPVFSLAESPFVTGHFLLETFGTFTPTQDEYLRWQQRQAAFDRLKAVGVQLVRGFFGGAK